MVQNRCKSAQTHYQILVYNSEIWPENQLVYTKSNCIGFRITSSVAMDYWCDKWAPGGM